MIYPNGFLCYLLTHLIFPCQAFHYVVATIDGVILVNLQWKLKPYTLQ